MYRMDENDAPSLVAQQLSVTRHQLGFELEDAARKAGLDPQRLAGAEASDVLLDDEALERLAGVYGVGLTAFFGGRTTEYNWFGGT